jgi:hypothetical protein
MLLNSLIFNAFPAGNDKGLSGIDIPERPFYESRYVGIKNTGLPHDNLKFYIKIYHAPFFTKSKEPRVSDMQGFCLGPPYITRRSAGDRPHIKDPSKILRASFSTFPWCI